MTHSIHLSEDSLNVVRTNAFPLPASRAIQRPLQPWFHVAPRVGDALPPSMRCTGLIRTRGGPGEKGNAPGGWSTHGCWAFRHPRDEGGRLLLSGGGRMLVAHPAVPAGRGRGPSQMREPDVPLKVVRGILSHAATGEPHCAAGGRMLGATPPRQESKWRDIESIPWVPGGVVVGGQFCVQRWRNQLRQQQRGRQFSGAGGAPWLPHPGPGPVRLL